jgi:hypothetical protein
MTRVRSALVLMLLAVCARASAQQAPPRIGPLVFDVHLTFPSFPSDSQPLADSRPLISVTDLPGLGRGIDIAAQLYLLKVRKVTFGVGGNLMIGTSHSTPITPPAGQVTFGHAVDERYMSFAPQLSINFGNGNGWSYLSGGIGQSTWSLIAIDPATGVGTEGPADQEPLETINYGGGARWFKKKHVGFSFDVRFYAINPGTPYNGFPGSPRTRLVVIGAGVSVK